MSIGDAFNTVPNVPAVVRGGSHAGRVGAAAVSRERSTIRAIRVLIFVNSMTGGGAERVVASLARYLVDHGHAVTIATMHGTERDFFVLDPRINRLCLELAGANRGLRKVYANVRRVAALRRAVVRESADVVVGMMSSSAILSILACAGIEARVVASERNFPGRKRLAFPWGAMRRLLYRFADAHVAQTDEAARWIARHARARNIQVIPNSVAWPVPDQPPAVAPDSIVDTGTPVVLAVGTKPHQKGFDMLVRAFASATSTHPAWCLVVVGVDASNDFGDGSGTNLETLAREIGVAGRVLFPGRAGNMTAWYERADIFVLSSRYEGFPNVLLEAMAAGRACIATDCQSGPSAIVDNEVNGLLVPVDDVRALGVALIRLMDDTSLRERLGSAAVAVRQRFSEERVLRQWQQLLESLSD